MEQQVAELVTFLRDKRPEVNEHHYSILLCCNPPDWRVDLLRSCLQARSMAADGVQGLTGSPEGLQLLSAHTAGLLPALFQLIPDQNHISKAALTALVNLSQVLHTVCCNIPSSLCLKLSFDCAPSKGAVEL